MRSVRPKEKVRTRILTCDSLIRSGWISGVLFTLLPGSLFAQLPNPQEDGSGIRIMFYNVENLFHPTNDSLKNDDEFTKEGTRYWSWKRYHDKVAKTAKTAIAVGGWEPPAIIGLCEIEEIRCLEDLVNNSPLKRFGYQIVHQESGDNRGIDVALLYRPELFEFIDFKSFVLNFPEEGSRPSRDILYVKGKVGDDTLHLFVNHWPSRYGGQLATVPKRNFAAKVLRSKYDSLLAENPNAHILAMGDFNDHPDDQSMLEIMRQWEFEKGTHKYQHEWGILDQFIASPALLNTEGLTTPMDRVVIFDSDFLMESEKDGIGKKPNRTYIGFKYHGGYSDHLPIYLDVMIGDGR
jgi:exonuclease III